MTSERPARRPHDATVRMLQPDALPASFFSGSSHRVAQALLGKRLVSVRNGVRIERVITDVEVYDGPHDLASHASRGRTQRNSIMFGPPGHWYVYLCYGMHWMLNVVIGKEGYPAAILIRGVDGASGPSRVTRLFGIDKRFNGERMSVESGLWVEESGIFVSSRDIKRTPRIGVPYAKEWALKPWRYVYEHGQSSRATSRKRTRRKEKRRN